MESSIHTDKRAQTFSETFRLLKPGGRLVAMEYNLLPGWNPKDPNMLNLMKMHLHGNGAAKTPTIEEDLQAFRDAGFDVVEHFDFMDQGEKIYGDEVIPWYADLQFNWRFQLLPAHPWVRKPLSVILKGLSFIGLVPEDVYKASDLLNEGGDGLAELGKLKAITTQYYVLAVKPLKTAAPKENIKTQKTQ
jgi:sterol 24-C-methyltransferase